METAPSQISPLLRIDEVSVVFPTTRGPIHAIEGVGFLVSSHRITGLVGESGSGKTTISRVIVGLEKPQSGSVIFDGTDLTQLTREQFRPYRRRIQMVFQDPRRALNPRVTVEQLLEEPLRIHFPEMSGIDRRKTVISLLDQVGLPSSIADRLPHALSGGQRQRIGIARALAVQPELLILDEPVSALDVSVQAQILNLLQDLKSELNLTCLFVSHDLAVVQHLCDEVVVMERGRVVETGSIDSVYQQPSHPYTRRLLEAAPRL